MFSDCGIPWWLMKTLMLNDQITSLVRLCPQLVKAEEAIKKLPENTPFVDFVHKYVIQPH
jgi:hypothetical protein